MSRTLGPTSIKVTGAFYSHVVEELDWDASELTAGLLLDQQRAR